MQCNARLWRRQPEYRPDDAKPAITPNFARTQDFADIFVRNSLDVSASLSWICTGAVRFRVGELRFMAGRGMNRRSFRALRSLRIQKCIRLFPIRST